MGLIRPRGRVLTGIRPTGRLHLGHYVGALKNWVAIQNRGGYECFFLIADLQALTTHADKPELLRWAIREVVLDWLAVGLDPSKRNIHFVQQSMVPERSQLSLLLQMITTVSEVQRNPTVKDEMAQQQTVSMGFFNYPVDQVADILMVTPLPWRHTDELLVPVGGDQIPHLELARVLARRFNQKYGKDIMTPCNPLVGQVERLVGTDGQGKMSKSMGNVIELADPPDVVHQKVTGMFTDPNRIRATDPGRVEGNPVFIYHDAFNPDKDEVVDLKRRYRIGKVGDVEVKEKLAIAINQMLAPMQERRRMYEDKDIRPILQSGSKRAQKLCRRVLAEAEDAMCLRL